MIAKIKFLILGAGPCGLALASELLKLKETSFLIVDRADDVGGLCRSKIVDGSPLDIGGGHFLDMKRKKVLDFLFDFLPEREWNTFERNSKIQINEFILDYPYEANIWQLPIDDQIEHLISIMNSGCNRGDTVPERFSEWITWKLGNLIANNYLLPYNSKIFANINLDDLGTYWLHKLPNVSIEDTLRSCLEKKFYGRIPAHSRFLYPKQFGYGEVFERIGQSLSKNLLLNYEIKKINFETLILNNEIQANTIISTIPWPEFGENETIPFKIKDCIDKLKYSSIDITYNPEEQETDSHWTYFPNLNLSYHRVLYRQNFLKDSKGSAQETNSLRMRQPLTFNYHNKYAYPLNTIDKPRLVNMILDWGKSNSVIGLGRWGEWEHMNSDVAIERSLTLAKRIIN